MHVNAFVPVEYVTLHGHAADALGIPQTSSSMPPIPEGSRAHQAAAPVLLCVTAMNGSDNDPHIYVTVHDASGEIRGQIQQLWMWEDSEHSPMKWRVFNLHVPFLVFGPGIYTFGVYTGPDHGPDQALSSFVIPITLDLPPEVQPTFRR